MTTRGDRPVSSRNNTGDSGLAREAQVNAPVSITVSRPRAATDEAQRHATTAGAQHSNTLPLSLTVTAVTPTAKSSPSSPVSASRPKTTMTVTRRDAAHYTSVLPYTHGTMRPLSAMVVTEARDRGISVTSNSTLHFGHRRTESLAVRRLAASPSWQALANETKPGSADLYDDRSYGERANTLPRSERSLGDGSANEDEISVRPVTGRADVKLNMAPVTVLSSAFVEQAAVGAVPLDQQKDTKCGDAHEDSNQQKTLAPTSATNGRSID